MNPSNTGNLPNQLVYNFGQQVELNLGEHFVVVSRLYNLMNDLGEF